MGWNRPPRVRNWTNMNATSALSSGIGKRGEAWHMVEAAFVQPHLRTPSHVEVPRGRWIRRSVALSAAVLAHARQAQIETAKVRPQDKRSARLVRILVGCGGPRPVRACSMVLLLSQVGRGCRVAMWGARGRGASEAAGGLVLLYREDAADDVARAVVRPPTHPTPLRAPRTGSVSGRAGRRHPAALVPAAPERRPGAVLVAPSGAPSALGAALGKRLGGSPPSPRALRARARAQAGRRRLHRRLARRRALRLEQGARRSPTWRTTGSVGRSSDGCRG